MTEKFKFHWLLFLRVQSTIWQCWFRSWSGAEQAHICGTRRRWVEDLYIMYVLIWKKRNQTIPNLLKCILGDSWFLIFVVILCFICNMSWMTTFIYILGDVFTFVISCIYLTECCYFWHLYQCVTFPKFQVFTTYAKTPKWLFMRF